MYVCFCTNLYVFSALPQGRTVLPLFPYPWSKVSFLVSYFPTYQSCPPLCLPSPPQMFFSDPATTTRSGFSGNALPPQIPKTRCFFPLFSFVTVIAAPFPRLRCVQLLCYLAGLTLFSPFSFFFAKVAPLLPPNLYPSPTTG